MKIFISDIRFNNIEYYCINFINERLMSQRVQLLDHRSIEVCGKFKYNQSQARVRPFCQQAVRSI